MICSCLVEGRKGAEKKMARKQAENSCRSYAKNFLRTSEQKTSSSIPTDSTPSLLTGFGGLRFRPSSSSTSRLGLCRGLLQPISVVLFFIFGGTRRRRNQENCCARAEKFYL